jgi:hypothetical protein
MLIDCNCPACNEPYQLSTELAGKHVKCRKCQATFAVPAQASGDAEIPVVQAAVHTAPPLIDVGLGPQTARSSAGVRPRRRLSREDETAPRQPASVLPWLLIGGIVCLLFFGIVVGGGFFIWVATQAAAEEERAQRERVQRQQAPVLMPAQFIIPGPPPGGAGQPKKPFNNPEKLYNLTLQNGVAVARSQLDFTDPTEPRGGFRKTFLINLPAGRRHHILLESKAFDAYLVLQDATGQVLAEDDDGAGPFPNLDALIDFTPAKAGVYRIIATSCGAGRVGDFTLTVRDLAAPAADAGKGGKQQNGQVTIGVTRITFPADKLVEDLVWAPDGSAFFGLTSDGVLSRVSGSGFTVTKKAELATRCTCLALSGEGLLATLPDTEEVCVIDPVTLTVLKRIPAPGVERAVSAPALKVAFATGKNGVTVLDLTKGLTANHFNKVPTLFGRVSPSGKYYFAQGGLEQLCSYRIEGHELIEHQRTDRIAQNGQRICVSPDSRYVGLPSSGGNHGTKYGTHVYSVENLKKPLLTLASGAYPRLVAFDARGELAFAQNHDKQLLVFTLNKGSQRAEFTLTAAGDEPKQFVPHPTQRKLLVLTDKTLQLVEIKSIGGK